MITVPSSSLVMVNLWPATHQPLNTLNNTSHQAALILEPSIYHTNRDRFGLRL